MSEKHSYFARHLRALSLKLMEANADICADLDPVLKPTWLSLIERMGGGEQVTVMDAARKMGVSHVHVQNILKAMKKAGVIASTADPDDGRRTYYELTVLGIQLLPKVRKLRDAMGAATREIEKETGSSLQAAVADFAAALDRQDWRERVARELK